VFHQSLQMCFKNEVHNDFQNQTCICDVKLMHWIDILKYVNMSIKVKSKYANYLNFLMDAKFSFSLVCVNVCENDLC
jgi:hypothetical protein